MPLKRAVLPLLDEQSDTTRIVSAANTVIVEEGRLRGENTDVPGVVAALCEHGVESVFEAVVLGGGATAASVIAALARLGLVSVTVAVRTPARATGLAALASSWGIAVEVEVIGPGLARSTQLVVSTIPSDAVAPVADGLVAGAAAVFDVVYDPWPTALASAARQTNVPFVSGLDLLAHQASLQVELMTGEPISATILRDAALAELRP